MADNRNTALYWAALYGRVEACTLALEGNVKLEYLQEYPGYKVKETFGANRSTFEYTKDWTEAELGRTAVHEAAINGSWELVELFLKHGWKSNLEDKHRPIQDQQDVLSSGGMHMQDLGMHVNGKRGKKPRTYAFENGHCEVANKIFLHDLERSLNIKPHSIDTYELTAQDRGNLLSYLLKHEEEEIEAFLDFQNDTTVSRETRGACLEFGNGDTETMCKSYISSNSSSNYRGGKNDIGSEEYKCKRCGYSASKHIKLNLNPLKQCLIEIADKGAHVNFHTTTGRDLLKDFRKPDSINKLKEDAAKNFFLQMKTLISDPEVKRVLPQTLRRKKYNFGATFYPELVADLETIKSIPSLSMIIREKISSRDRIRQRVEQCINEEQYIKTNTANVLIAVGEHITLQMERYDHYVSTIKKRSATAMASSSEHVGNTVGETKTLKKLLEFLLNGRTDKPPFLIVLDEVVNLLRGHFAKIMSKA